MSKLDTKQLRNKVYQIERSIRSLRSMLEMEIELTEYGCKSVSQISNGLSNILSSDFAMSHKKISPYERYFEGLHCAFNSEKHENIVGVYNYVFKFETEDSVPVSASHALHVKLDEHNPADWLTLEVELDVAELQKVEDLEINFTPYFKILKNANLENFKLVVRCFNEGGYHDYYPISFPAIGMPVEFKYKINKSKYQAFTGSNFSKAAIIFFLPASKPLDYVFALSHFEINGTSVR